MTELGGKAGKWYKKEAEESIEQSPIAETSVFDRILSNQVQKR